MAVQIEGLQVASLRLCVYEKTRAADAGIQAAAPPPVSAVCGRNYTQSDPPTPHPPPHTQAIATRRGIGLSGASIATADLPSGPRMRRSQRPALRRLARLSTRNQTEHARLRRRKQRRGPFQPPASGILGQAVGHSIMLHPHACRLQGRTTALSSRDQDQAVSSPTRCRAHWCPTCRLDPTAKCEA